MFDDLQIEVTEEMLAKRAGSRGGVSEKILEQCRKAMEIGEKLLEPRTIHDVFTIEKIGENRLFLEQGCCFESEHLAKLLDGADRIVVMCCTIGSGVEKRVGELNSNGYLADAYFLDVYGSVAVGVLARKLYRKIREQFAGYGATVYMEPGQLDWNVRDQQVVFRLIHPEKIGVTLNSGMMMSPVKSLTGVFGIGEPGRVKAGNFSCEFCPKRESCTFRHEAEGMMEALA